MFAPEARLPLHRLPARSALALDLLVGGDAAMAILAALLRREGKGCNIEVVRRLLALGATPQNVYGMTKNSAHQYTRPNDPVEVIASTCGKFGSGYEVRLWDQVNGGGARRGVGDWWPQRRADAGLLQQPVGYRTLFQLQRLVSQRRPWSFRRAGQPADRRPQKRLDRLRRPQHPPDTRRGICPSPCGGEKATAFCATDERLAKEGIPKCDMPEFYAVVEEFPMTKIVKRELVQWVATGYLQPQPVRYRTPAK